MEIEEGVTALAALAQPTRLQVFRMLVKAGPDGMPAGEIARRLDIPANTLSAHLAVLSHAGLVGSKRNGRSVIYSAQYRTMRELLNYLTEDCCRGHPEITGTGGKTAKSKSSANTTRKAS